MPKQKNDFSSTCILFAILTISLIPARNVWAQNLDSLLAEPIMLGKIIVSAQRTEKEEGEVAEDSYVLSGKDIEGLPSRNVSEALKYIPGLDVKVNNQFGQSTDLSIHGSDSRQVLLLLDGIPFNTQLSGQANPTRLPLEDVERIEVIKGGASSVWGSSLGGVVNVITKDVGTTEKPQGTFKTSYAEFSTIRNSLDLAGKVKDLGYYLSGSYAETDGIKSKSDAKEKSGFLKLSNPLGDQAKLTGYFGSKSGEVEDGVNPDGKWYSMPYISRYGLLKLDVGKSESNFSAAYKYNDQDITNDRYNGTTNAFESDTKSSNLYQGLSLNGSLKAFNDDLLVYGADFDWHTLKSNQYLSSSKHISMQAPYANYTLKLDKLDIIGGLRYDNNQAFGSQTSPSLGAVYNFSGKHLTRVRGKISRAFNAPPLLWRYNEAGIYKPNPDIQAEKAMVYEAGLEVKIFQPLSAKLDLYRSDVKDALAWTKMPDGINWYVKNFRKFRRQGAELLLELEVNDRISLFGSGAFNDVKNLETKQMVRDQTIARESFKLGAKFKNKGGFGVNLIGSYNRWSSNPSQANDRKFIFDAKFTQEFKNIRKSIDFEFFLNLYNLTNSKYWSSITYPLPKRYFEGGLTVKF